MEQMGEFIGFTALIVIGSILLVAFRTSVTEFLKRRLGMKVVGGFRKRIKFTGLPAKLLGLLYFVGWGFLIYHIYQGIVR